MTKLDEITTIYNEMTGDPATALDVLTALSQYDAQWLSDAPAREIAGRLAADTFEPEPETEN